MLAFVFQPPLGGMWGLMDIRLHSLYNSPGLCLLSCTQDKAAHCSQVPVTDLASLLPAHPCLAGTKSCHPAFACIVSLERNLNLLLTSSSSGKSKSSSGEFSTISQSLVLSFSVFISHRCREHQLHTSCLCLENQNLLKNESLSNLPLNLLGLSTMPGK